MGKGDKRSKRGKIFKNSFGKKRPAKPNPGKADSRIETIEILKVGSGYPLGLPILFTLSR